MSPIYLR